MAKCNCSDGIFNSGIPSCPNGTFGRIKKLIFVSYYDSLGNINSISSSDVLDNAFFEGKVNETDLSLRYYPSDTIFNIVNERGDDIVETIEGISFEIENGVRNFTGEFVNKFSASPAYLKFLNSLKCPIVGYYGVDEYGVLVGDGRNGDESLRPFLIQQGSLKTKFIPKTATTVAKNSISFALDKSMEDQAIQSLETEDEVNLLNLNGLISVTLEQFVSSSTTEVSGNAYISCSNSVRNVGFAGSLVNNWIITNVTTASNIIPTSILATGDYGFDFTFNVADVNSGDVLKFQIGLAGYEAVPSIEVTLV